MRRIGVLTAGVADNLENKARIEAFVQGLRDAADTRKHASELVSLAPDRCSRQPELCRSCL
jgi:hypothetical protein